MGGRGSAGGFIAKIPRADKAHIPDAKVVKYLLKPETKHYEEFIAVGYSKNDPDRLKSDLLNGLQSNRAKVYEANKHGNTAYEVDMTLGITTKARFRTAWQIDKGSDSPRFVTAYRIGGKSK